MPNITFSFKENLFLFKKKLSQISQKPSVFNVLTQNAVQKFPLNKSIQKTEQNGSLNQEKYDHQTSKTAKNLNLWACLLPTFSLTVFKNH